ncbi:MAG: carboxypeptidase regulatory-like domain-containing protein [Planctomycetota bacterium]
MTVHLPLPQRVCRPPRRLPAYLLLAFLFPSIVTLAETVTAGEIRGNVRYRFDRSRPWRYSRYYVRQGKSGDLSEAVVALSQRGRKWDPNLFPKTEPKTAVMDQKNFDFTPELLAIRARDSVRFTNSDTQPHNVFTQWRDWGFNITMPAGESHVQSFPRAGNHLAPYRLGCHLHGQMRAWIYVFDHPYFQVTKADGGFHLVNVPTGEYELVVLHPAGNLSSTVSVVVLEQETAIANVELTPDNELRTKTAQ